MKRFIVLIALAAFVGAAHAETLKGRISTVSKQAGTIQIDVGGEDGAGGKAVVRANADTRYEGASGLDDLGPPDLIEVEREPGQPASSIKKIVFGLPPGVEISVKELLAIMTRGDPYHLYDARPAKPFGAGHVPGAKSAFPKDADFLAKLPAEKDALLVFYCGGPTCPFTGVAVKTAQEAGYTNLKGFQAGLPGWKKARLPVHVDGAWLGKNLDPQHVVLDVRDKTRSDASHIKGAVALPTSELQAMTTRFIEQQVVAQLPGVSDQRAAVIVYADSHTSREALLAYKELRDWGYGNATVLRDGFSGWMAAGLPVENGPAATQIVYQKKLAPGAVAFEEFAALQASGQGVLIIDVRSDQEVARGAIPDARHIPLDKLEDALADLPRDKEILVYCANGIRAEMAYQTLNGRGFRSRYLNETLTIAADGSYKN